MANEKLWHAAVGRKRCEELCSDAYDMTGEAQPLFVLFYLEPHVAFLNQVLEVVAKTLIECPTLSADLEAQLEIVEDRVCAVR